MIEPAGSEAKEMTQRTISYQLSHNDMKEPRAHSEDLYNLKKLAEVAVASGQLLDKRKNGSRPTSPISYTHKLFDRSSKIVRPHLLKQQPSTESGDGENRCDECGKKYSTSSNLARHRQTHRSPGDKEARKCPHCDKLYVSVPAFSMHMRTHNQGCRCHYCGKCFSRPWLLQGHIRTHTGEKPFRCPKCDKAFADKSNLRAHIQTHSNTKPHVCARCGKAFALKSYLYKHEESSCMRAHAGKALATPPADILHAQVKEERDYLRRYKDEVSRFPKQEFVADIQDEPMDFSSKRKIDEKPIGNLRSGFGISFSIAV